MITIKISYLSNQVVSNAISLNGKGEWARMDLGSKTNSSNLDKFSLICAC